MGSSQSKYNGLIRSTGEIVMSNKTKIRCVQEVNLPKILFSFKNLNPCEHLSERLIEILNAYDYTDERNRESYQYLTRNIVRCQVDKITFKVTAYQLDENRFKIAISNRDYSTYSIFY